MPRRRNPARVAKQVTAQTLVGLVLRAPVPGDAGLSSRRIGRARLDRAPADGLAIEVGDEAARRARSGARSGSACGAGPPTHRPAPSTRLLRPHLEPLALAIGRVAAHAEDGLEILPARLVGRDDRDRRRRRVGHRDASLGWKSIRMTTRRSVARSTSSKPAASNMLRVPTWVSPQVTSCPGSVIIG